MFVLETVTINHGNYSRKLLILKHHNLSNKREKCFQQKKEERRKKKKKNLVTPLELNIITSAKVFDDVEYYLLIERIHQLDSSFIDNSVLFYYNYKSRVMIYETYFL